MEKILPNGCLSPELSHHGIRKNDIPEVNSDVIIG